jgi:hypothetical protein
MRPLISVVAMMCAALPARAAVLADWSLEECIAHADNVVIGTVTGKRVVQQGDDIITETMVRVERPLYGPVVKQLVVSQLGGTIGARTVDVPGDAHLSIGDRLVVMTEHKPSGRNILVGLGLGVYKLDGSEARQRIDASIMRRDGSVLSPPVLRNVPLQQIIQVANAVRAAARP